MVVIQKLTERLEGNTSVGYVYIHTNPSFPDYVKIGFVRMYKEEMLDVDRCRFSAQKDVVVMLSVHLNAI